jgi:hypothetical protein
MEKKSKKKDKQRAAAFVNWEVTTKTGIVVKSDRGFPIFQNPEYPNAKEDLLVAAAGQTENGILELDMKVRICLNAPVEAIVKPEDLF